MILYLDSSNLVKLYLQEEESELVQGIIDQATSVGTSLIAYVEVRAGLARARRQGRLTDERYRAVLMAFEEEWNTYTLMEITEPIIRFAGDLADKHALKGYDAVHLASALTLQRDVGEAISFSASDRTLLAAARAEGL